MIKVYAFNHETDNNSTYSESKNDKNRYVLHVTVI